jgi:hypothetical protein
MKTYPLNVSDLLSQLKTHLSRSEQKLQSHHPNAISRFHELGVHPSDIRLHAARLAASGAIAGAMLLSGPLYNHVISSDPYAHFSSIEREQFLSKQLLSLLPPGLASLSPGQEQAISETIAQVWGVRAVAVLNNERLNRSYGLIGAEQHLPRYPGDSVDQHGEPHASGITPGLGAWGYFANSKDQMTQDLIQKEKFYVAVQTLYLPDWQSRLPYLREWYKYRKVLVVNPQNGKSVIADIADSGPASWTGKHFGGSPEVMSYLELNTGMQKGPVLVFFVDDADNVMPLGPVEYNVATGTSVTENQ